MEESGFLASIQKKPRDEELRLIYADWLEEREDERAHFIRLHLALMSMPPDHVNRLNAEQELSALKAQIDYEWLTVIAPELTAYEIQYGRQLCKCLDEESPRETQFHCEVQDTECDAWKRLLDLIEDAAADGRSELNPGKALGVEFAKIVTLPPTIAKLKAVTRLFLYGSSLTRIPPEIGEMTCLESFTPYTSYRLHWFPYEITRCLRLRDSTVSTRAIYGNYKNRLSFPFLAPWNPESVNSVILGCIETKWIRKCSVCEREFEDQGHHRAWISLPVATDVFPLLVNACSQECIDSLPTPRERYVQNPHRGGPEIQQPPPW